MARYSLLGLYKGDSNQVYQYDKANAVNELYNKTAIVTKAKLTNNANTKKVFTYDGEDIIQFYSRDNLNQAGQTSPNKNSSITPFPKDKG